MSMSEAQSLGSDPAAQVQHILDEIGNWTSPAAELEKRGIKGDRDDCNTCPMANYIASVMPPEVQWVRVNGTTSDIRYTTSTKLHPNDPDVTYVNPGNMVRFINWFDEGEYPELDNNPDNYWDCPCCSGSEDPRD